MENGIDFVYEYSDLNDLKTRVEVLTGKYAGLIFEYGGSILAQWENKNTFTFEYTLYEVPNEFDGPSLRKDPEFNEFIAYLLVDVINTRNNDIEEKKKSDEAASPLGFRNSKIKIDPKFYSKQATVI